MHCQELLWKKLLDLPKIGYLYVELLHARVDLSTGGSLAVDKVL